MNIKKYAAMAFVGTGLAFAAAAPASACGGFGMVGVPVFGAAFGGCGPYGFAAPAPAAFGWGGGCAPVAFGCGAMGAAYPAFGAGYGGCGCGGYGSVAWHRPLGLGYGFAWRRPIGFGIAWHRPIGYGYGGYAYHRPYGYGIASRSYRPYALASRHYRTYSYASYSPRYHARGYAFSHGARYASHYGQRRYLAMRPSHRFASHLLSRWG